MKILILDIYKKTNYRISKDTSGGYGTGNDFGDSFTSKVLKKKLKKSHDWPPLFAAYTHSVLKKKGHNVVYLKEIPKNFLDFDIFIVVSSIVCCEEEIKSIKKISLVKKKVFAIGPFATNKPEKYIKAGATVISGEPEFYFFENNDFNKDLLNQIINVNNQLNLDDLPYPIWNELLDNKNVSSLFGKFISVPILGTRGCPYSCFKYCVYPLQQGRNVRQRTPKNIVDEIEYWSNKKVKMFIFRDPVFSINKKHTVDFCNKLIERNLNIKFVIETHLRILDNDLIRLLKRAGLKAVKVGVESFDPNVLEDSGRFTVSRDQQYDKIRELEKNKIQVSAMFILGFPSDNDKSINQTINYAKKLNTTYAQFSVWTPYPGTPVFKEYENKIITSNYEDFDQYRLVYQHKLFDKETIRKYLSKAYSDYYFRLSWLFKYLLSFNNS